MKALVTSVTIASKDLEVEISPSVGGTITKIIHLGTGLSVLGKVPWDPIETPISSFAARNEIEWLTRYTGGWPLLFPNGGDACTVDGVFHGFHGEASIAPWKFSATANAVQLSRRFFTVPVDMHREIIIEKDMLIIHERLHMRGASPIDVMWGHHPTFGTDLLAGPVEITTGARRVTVDDTYDPAANPLRPGAASNWPMAEGKRGSFDLSLPSEGMTSLAYLHDFEQAWIAMRRTDNAIATVLSWDANRFPCAWIWYELEGTADAPWYGNGRVICIEPNTTMRAYGLATAKSRGSPLLRLLPNVDIETTLRLHVFKPKGSITLVDKEGRASRA